jgi:hypothetical protein
MAEFRARSTTTTVWSNTSLWETYDTGSSSWVLAGNIPTISDKVWLNGISVTTDSSTTAISFLRLMTVITGTGNVPSGSGTVTGGTLTISTTSGATINVTCDINNGVFGTASSTINVTSTGKTVNFINMPITNTGSSVNIVTISGSSNTITYTRTAGSATGMFTPAASGTCLYGNSGTGNSITIGDSTNSITITPFTFSTAASVFSSCTLNSNITATTVTAFNPGAIGTLTINGNITGGTAGTAYGFSMATILSANIYITGTILGGTNSTAYGIFNSTSSVVIGTFSINGSINASTANAINWGGGTGSSITNFSIIGTVSSNGSVPAITQGGGMTFTNFTIQNSTITGGTHTTPIIGSQTSACNLVVDNVSANVTNSPVFGIATVTAGSTNQITYKNTCALNNGTTDSAVTPFGIASGRIIASNGCTFKYKNSNVPASGTDPLIFAITGTPPTLLDKKWVASTAPQFTDSTNTLTYGTLLVPSPANVLKDNVYGVGVTADPTSGNADRSVGTLDIPNAVAQVVGNIVANLT